MKQFLGQISRSLRLDSELRYAFLPDGTPVDSVARIPLVHEDISLSSPGPYLKPHPLQKQQQRSVRVSPEPKTGQRKGVRRLDRRGIVQLMGGGGRASSLDWRGTEETGDVACCPSLKLMRNAQKITACPGEGEEEKKQRVQLRLRALLSKGTKTIERSPETSQRRKKRTDRESQGPSAKELARLSRDTGLTRKQLIDYYARFRSLCMASKSSEEGSIVGVSQKKFAEDVEMTYAEYRPELVARIFELANASGKGRLTWPEYVHAMSIIRTDQDTQKLELFFQSLERQGHEFLTHRDVVAIAEKMMRKLELDQARIGRLVKDFTQLIYETAHAEEPNPIPLFVLKQVRNNSHRI